MNLPLTQSWLPGQEADFRHGNADFSWNNGRLILTADLFDANVLTTATAHGQRLWEHGDVAELFVQKIGEEGYREYQVAPNGFTLALTYPDLSGVAALRSGERQIEDFFCGDPFEARGELTATGWMAHFSIPLDSFPGGKFRVSCCCYDAAAGRATIISSTSPHPVCDFHRPQDWREIIFMEE